MDCFRSLLDRPEVALAVRQKKTKVPGRCGSSEPILSLSSPSSVQIGKLSATEDDRQLPPTVPAVQQQAEASAMTELLQSLLTRMDQLEVWNLSPYMRVGVQAHTHATSYLLRVISTNDKNTSSSSSILRVSFLVYIYTHIVKSLSRTFLFCILVAISIVLTG